MKAIDTEQTHAIDGSACDLGSTTTGAAAKKKRSRKRNKAKKQQSNVVGDSTTESIDSDISRTLKERLSLDQVPTKTDVAVPKKLNGFVNGTVSNSESDDAILANGNSVAAVSGSVALSLPAAAAAAAIAAGETVPTLVCETNPPTSPPSPPPPPIPQIDYLEYQSELQMPDIMRLIQKDLSEPYSIYTYRYFIHNWPKLCFLAMHGAECVGAIVCKLDIHRQTVKRGYIAMLAVDKAYRKLKIGTNLVQKAIQAMLTDNADEVVLETEITNTPALRLYENLGFVRDKRLFHYYLNGVDALRLKLWFR